MTELNETVQGLVIIVIVIACLRMVWHRIRKPKPHPAPRRRTPVRKTKHKAPAKAAEWIPVGKPIIVQGRRLPDGMVFVGSSLRHTSPYASIDPASIDPSLPVNNSSPDIAGSTMGYWPSYDELTPSARAAYLDWLASGRPAGAYIGYVFLFFYGIERRLLYDNHPTGLADEEVDALIDEVDRLLTLYPDSNSFNQYASDFLSFARYSRPNFSYTDLEPPSVRGAWDFSLGLKIGLGDIVASGNPLPAAWALSWLRLHREISLRTPAIRCEHEFTLLFKLRYRESHGDGVVIKRNKTPLTVSYNPANSSLGSLVTTKEDRLPDVTRLRRPVRQLHKLADAVTDELDSYSRWVGRHDDRDSLAAIALLPRELAVKSDSDALRDLQAMIDSALDGREVATLPSQKLLADYPSQRPNIFSAREATAFSGLLERLGVGIAPDIRYSKVNLSRHEYAAVFRSSDQQTRPTDGYLAATVLLQLGTAVGAADGTVTADEERLLSAHLERSLDLPAADRTRLRAHLQWLLVEPPDLQALRSRMKALTHSDRSLIARFVVSVAGADGTVSSSEIRALTQIYKLVGLEADQLHRDIHELGAGPPTQPVTVIHPDKTAGYRVPEPPAAQSLRADQVDLDQEKIAEVMKSTRDVSDLLTTIFEGSAEPDTPESDIAVAESDDDVSPSMDIEAGLLDQAHTELVRLLARRSRWTRTDVEQSAKDFGLMPVGAIETINDAAFQLCDEPLIEGDDLLEVNELALKELLNVS